MLGSELRPDLHCGDWENTSHQSQGTLPVDRRSGPFGDLRIAVALGIQPSWSHCGMGYCLSGQKQMDSAAALKGYLIGRMLMASS